MENKTAPKKALPKKQEKEEGVLPMPNWANNPLWFQRKPLKIPGAKKKSSA